MDIGDLDEVRRKAMQEYGHHIQLIKDAIGEGAEYTNGLVRIILSPKGGYYEFKEMPEEFSGWVGPSGQYESVDSKVGMELVGSAYNIISSLSRDNTSELQIITCSGNKLETAQICIVNFDKDFDPPITALRGDLPRETLPTFMKIKGQSELLLPLLGCNEGLIVFASYVSDQHLLIKVPADINPVDLAKVIFSTSLN